jgi:PBP1b-binding outer membrane lipoprotein LpoB
MKKTITYLVLAITALTFTSCSKDDTSSSSSNTQTIQLKIDGVEKTFSIDAAKIGNEISVVGTLTSSSNKAASETITFNASENAAATEIYNFTYTSNGINYQQDVSFTSSLTLHGNGKLKGNFSGPTIESTNGETKLISEGSIDITYDTGTPSASDISDALHMSFNTPDWSRFINCELLDFSPWPLDSYTNYVGSTSQSTNQSFYFSMPADSSAMNLTSNLKKYAIRDYSDYLQGPFEFSQKLPLQSGSSARLISQDGLSAASYNEVAEIKYVGSEPNYALFKVKCRYKMMTYELNNPSNTKQVTGTFNLKVRTSKN